MLVVLNFQSTCFREEKMISQPLPANKKVSENMVNAFAKKQTSIMSGLPCIKKQKQLLPNSVNTPFETYGQTIQIPL